MNIRPLVIGNEQREAIKKVRDYAEAHTLTVRDMMRIRFQKGVPPGENPNHVCVIPLGYRCVFTMEARATGLWRHLSVSVNEKSKYVNPPSLVMIAIAFGFKLVDGVSEEQAIAETLKAFDPKHTEIWPEKMEEDWCAINIAQEADDLPSPIIVP